MPCPVPVVKESSGHHHKDDDPTGKRLAILTLTALGVVYGRDLGKHVTLSAGPSLNVLVSDWQDPETGAYRSTAAPSSLLWENENTEVREQGWVGWHIAAGYRF